MSMRIKIIAALIIGLVASVVYDITFAAAACYPSIVDPLGIVASLPDVLSTVGLTVFIAILVVLVAAQRSPWQTVPFRNLLLAASLIAICLSALAGCITHPHGVPCAI